MRMLKLSLLIVILNSIALTAHANGDLKRMPIGAPKAFSTECSSCHNAYSPKLLPAQSWARLMGGLDSHFGTDASLTKQEAADITRWLVENAATYRKRTEEPPEDRITASSWFKKEHREISKSVWTRDSIKGPFNCLACHSQADKGNYDDDTARIPR